MVKRRKEPQLGKIILVILVIGGAAVGVLKFTEWFQGMLGQRVEATAPDDMQQARKLIESGDLAQARELLGPIIARVDNPNITPQALLLQADIEFAAGNLEEALAQYKQAIDDYPESPDHPVFTLQYARLLENESRFDEAMPLYRDVFGSAPPDIRAPAVNALAREKERSDDITGAQDLYRKALDEAPMNSPAWNEAAERYGAINTLSIFSKGETKDSKTYRIQRGDSLTSIGSKLNTTQGLLMRANGIINPNRISLNQPLKYTPKDFEIVIERSTCRIFLLDNNGLFKVYQSGLGKPGHETAVGKYKIGNKEKNPTWHKPGQAPIPPGDPENELGSRWMPMIPEEGGLPVDLGIHGTINPDSIGIYSSSGCPRMHNQDVEELYDLVVRSTPVTVVDIFNIKEKI